VAVIGPVEGEFTPGRVDAVVDEPSRRDTERNHTATHLLHAALRRVLGEHVFQQGSLVAPDRLRFDFSHTGPLDAEEIAEIELLVNEAIWLNDPVATRQMKHRDAISSGAMALFGEKYPEEVRVVEIAGISMELCGGTHVRSTGQIGSFRIISESGVAAGVRRIEAVTGPAAYARSREDRSVVRTAAEQLRTRPDSLLSRLNTVLAENRELHRQLQKARTSGGADTIELLLAKSVSVEGLAVVTALVEVDDLTAARDIGDRLRERMSSGIAVLGAEVDGKASLFAVATDDAIQRGIRADRVVRETANLVGGRGGGRPHMAQAGIPDASRLREALEGVSRVVGDVIAAAEIT
jgi:alanyl-tRNA synthetase